MTIPSITSILLTHYFTDSLSDFIRDAAYAIDIPHDNLRDILIFLLADDISDLTHNDPDSLLPPSDDDDRDILALDFLIDNLDAIIESLADSILSR